MVVTRELFFELYDEAKRGLADAALFSNTPLVPGSDSLRLFMPFGESKSVNTLNC